MRNDGFGKFEVMTIIVVLLGIFAYLGYQLTKPNLNQQMDSMRASAVSFTRVVINNYSTFHNEEVTYLGEAIDEELMKNVKNPFGSGYCSASESKVERGEDKTYTTFRCGQYLFEREDLSGNAKVTFYEVSDWSEEKTSEDMEEKVLFNCLTSGVERYPEYYEELYFVSRVNKEFATGHYLASTIKGECDVVTKTLYRTKKKVELEEKDK